MDPRKSDANPVDSAVDPQADRIRLIMSLRCFGILDTKVLSAIEQVARTHFVPHQLLDTAYSDRPLPIGHGQTISQPFMVAKMTQDLQLEAHHRVLEIGTGSGYQTSILAHLCRQVFTIERIQALLLEAVGRFEKLHLNNIESRFGDGTQGWAEQAPFHRIMVTAVGESEPPAELLEQLAPNGILLIPLADGRTQWLVRFRKSGNWIQREELIEVRFVPLLTGTVAQGT